MRKSLIAASLSLAPLLSLAPARAEEAPSPAPMALRWEQRRASLQLNPGPYPGPGPIIPGCGTVRRQVAEILDLLGATQIRMNCDDRSSLRAVRVDAGFEVPVEAAANDPAARPGGWQQIQYMMQVDYGCALSGDIVEQVQDFFKLRNFSSMLSCNGEAGTISLSGEALRFDPAP